ncbi:hypothetical protein [Brachybacterium hainanense]|uniref:DUF4352 domain-containing protein n=1 Tax=Brachybacterium hainanense TaxID=1541174 RepID=A0ABV6R8Y9_9MICO
MRRGVNGSGGDEDPSPVRTSSPVTTAPDEEAAAADTTAAEAPTEETTLAVPAGEIGTSRDNPAQPVTDSLVFDAEDGTTAVTLGNVVWDANGTVADANMFNEEAPEGQVCITVPVTMSYSGSASITPWLELSISCIADDGRGYDEATLVLEDDLMNVGDLYDGGVAEGGVVFLIPESAVGSGVFSVAPLMSITGEELFVAAV